MFVRGHGRNQLGDDLLQNLLPVSGMLDISCGRDKKTSEHHFLALDGCIACSWIHRGTTRLTHRCVAVC